MLTKTPATNTGFASGGVTCELGALCFYSSSVLVDSFVLRNPPLNAKRRNRYAACLNEIPEFRKSRQQIKTKLIIGQQNKLTINKIITFENQLKTK
jgi:hypothetical protein